MKVHK